ncbi:MAG: pseudaminic acid cytidylyltransferase [Lachnospiraceae bacterium]|jgi:N-acylneuraminate cytidylyltransferase|nr:pseudaminic acid cytidylyltransferase [Lachnospiraceae bacterium]
MSSVAIITARGGSKRIPKKNIREFCGKPIIAYSIEAALGSGIFDEVMVSTDDVEIADIAKAFGAKVPFFRSEKTSNDFATTADVISEVLDKYEKMGKSFDYACCVYPTAPFITAEKLKLAMEKLQSEGGDSAMPVVKFSFPPQRCLVINDGSLEYKWPENMNKRSQDLEPFYHDCGQYYVFKVSSFRKSGQIVGGKVIPIVTPDTEVQDIDEMTDWEIAELKYKILHK